MNPLNTITGEKTKLPVTKRRPANLTNMVDKFQCDNICNSSVLHLEYNILVRVFKIHYDSIKNMN